MRIILFGLAAVALLIALVACNKDEQDAHIRVTFPNGGELWGDIGRPVNFQTSGEISRVTIQLEDWRGNPAGGPLTWDLEQNLPVESAGKYAITAIRDLRPAVQSGNHFKILVWATVGPKGKSKVVEDSSDDYFSIDLDKKGY